MGIEEILVTEKHTLGSYGDDLITELWKTVAGQHSENTDLKKKKKNNFNKHLMSTNLGDSILNSPMH